MFSPVISHFLTPNRNTVIFAVKGVISMAAALFISMHLELDRPYWAVVASMLLQARPESGLVTEKALYLVAGSWLGGIYAVLTIGAFSEMPFVAIALLTVWVGVTSFFSAKVQHVNYNYFLGLTGVTAPLITLLAMSDASAVSPLQVFEIARARISEGMVGAFCAAAVSIFFVPFRLRDLLQIHAEQTFSRLTGLIFAELTAETSKQLRYKNSGALLAAVSQLNHDARASSYDGPDGTRRARACYEISNLSIVASSVAQTLGYQINADADSLGKNMRYLLGTARQVIGKLAEEKTYAKRQALLTGLQKELRSHKLTGRLETAPEVVAFRMLCRITGMLLSIARIASAIKNHRNMPLQAKRLPAFQDDLVAGIAALRSMIVFLSCIALWIGTGSPPAVLMMMILPPFFSMAFAPAPIPEMIVRKVIIGAVVAIPASAFIELFLLSAGSGNFELLIMVMGGPLFIALMAVAWAPTMPYGLGFCLPFVLLTQPGNEMSFSADGSVTTGLALLTGLGILWAVFSLMKTPDNAFIKNRIMRSFSRDLKFISERKIKEDDFVYKTGGKVIKLFSLKSAEAHLAGLQALRNLHITFTLFKLLRDNHSLVREEIYLWLRDYRLVIAGIYQGNHEEFCTRGQLICDRLKGIYPEGLTATTANTEARVLLGFALEIADDHFRLGK